MNNSRRLSQLMTSGELLWGSLYFLFYLIALPSLLSLLFEALGWDAVSALGQTRLNFLYFVLNFLAAVVIFHRFLWKNLGNIGKRFWGFVQAVILGWVMLRVSVSLMGYLAALLRPALRNLNDDYFGGQAAASLILTAVGTVLLAPAAEECFFRGLLVQGLHRKNRVLAYTVSALAFALVHVASYLGRYGLVDSLLILLQYLPAGVALGWAYEKSDTIFAPILIHMVNNAISMGLMSR